MNQRPEDVCDVAVVGGGPAGSVAAFLLARRGLRVVLIDSLLSSRPKPCGEFLAPRGCAVLSRAGLLDGLVARGQPHRRLTLNGRWGHLGLDLPGFALGIQREVLDEHLLQAASERAEIRRGVPVTGLQRAQKGGWRLTFRDGSELQAAVVVGADGRHSRVRTWSGLGATRPTTRHALAVRVRGLLPPSAQGQPPAEMHLGPLGQVGICPLVDGESNVNVLLTPAGAARLGEGTWPLVQAALALIPALASRSRHLTATTPVLAVSNLRQVPTSVVSSDGIALIRDAALCADPFTGEGMSNACESAEFFATCLVGWQPGSDPGRFLAAYARSHRRRFAPARWETALLPALLDHPRLADICLAAMSLVPGIRSVLGARHHVSAERGEHRLALS